MRRTGLLVVMSVVLVPAIALATAAFGVISNVILAQGTTAGALDERISVSNTDPALPGDDHGEGWIVGQGDDHGKGFGGNPEDEWELILKTNGASDFYFQDVVVGPGGRSGWHSHPGVLMIAVKEGSIDWYDKDCVKHTYTAGQSFTENTESHNLFNTGTLNAHLLISYIIKAGAPRRIEQPQPACGAALGLP